MKLLDQSGLHNSENKEKIKAKDCSITSCSPQFHDLLTMCNVDFVRICFAVRFIIILCYSTLKKCFSRFQNNRMSVEQ